MQTLTLEEVKAAARKAYDENRLLAQWALSDPALVDENGFTGEYGYLVGQYCCGIGAALTAETLSDLQSRSMNLDTSITSLVHDGRVTLGEPNQLPTFEYIQNAHDRWLDSPTDTGKRDAFLRLIDHLSVKESAS